MHILTRWNIRMVRANLSRTITVLFAVVGFFALWVCADYMVVSAVYKEGISDAASLGIRMPLINFIRNNGLFSGCFLWVRNFLERLYTGTLLNNPFFRAMISYLSFGLLLVIVAVLYSVFSVTSDETLRDYRILKSAGTTARQIRRSLLHRAVVLDLGGAAIGIALGLFFAWLTMGFTAVRSGKAFAQGTDRFLGALPSFVSDPRTLLTLSLFLLLIPCVMALAAFRAVRRKQKNIQPRESKRGILYPARAWRLFGIGGVLAGISGKTNRRYRAIFTFSFAVCIAVLALLDNILLLLQETQPLRDDLDLSLDYYEFGVDSPVTGTDVLHTILYGDPDRLRVENEATVLFQSEWSNCCYTLLNSDWIAEPMPDASLIGESFERDGISVCLCKSGFVLAFLDDVSFHAYARQCGAEETAEAGAILYATAAPETWTQDQTAPLRLQTVDPQQDITLHFVPYTFLYNSTKDMEADPTLTLSKPIWNVPTAEYLRAADPVSVKKTIRILALTQTPPEPFDSSISTPRTLPYLIFPKSAYNSFAQTLSGVDTSPDYEGVSRSRTLSFYHLQDPEAGVAAFREAVKADPRLADYEKVFGIGSRSSNRNDREEDSTFSVPLAYLQYADLHNAREKLTLFRSMVPQMRRILLLMVVWVLFVGILNTAHMNRLTRRREYAILESIGLDGRQKTGMLLYESARYALCGALLAWVGFLGLFFPVWRDFQNLLRDNDLFFENNSPSVWDTVFGSVTQKDWGLMLQEFAKSYARTWRIFVVGGVLIFALMVVTDKFVERRFRREELILILKDDSIDDYASDC